MEAMGKKTKALRDEDRDISEKIALGEIPAGTARSAEALYDQRLFNQSMGMDSGFGSDESYNIYDKALHAGTTHGQLYKPKKSENDEEEISEGTMKRILDTTRFKPDKGFSGAEAGSGQVSISSLSRICLKKRARRSCFGIVFLLWGFPQSKLEDNFVRISVLERSGRNYSSLGSLYTTGD